MISATVNGTNAPLSMASTASQTKEARLQGDRERRASTKCRTQHGVAGQLRVPINLYDYVEAIRSRRNTHLGIAQYVSEE